jgi:hypothetical protein
MTNADVYICFSTRPVLVLPTRYRTHPCTEYFFHKSLPNILIVKLRDPERKMYVPVVQCGEK